MKKHTKIYLNFFGFKIPEDCSCEVCGKPAVDINHILARGMGGNPLGDKDEIENLMAMCRSCHVEFGDAPGSREMLVTAHKLFIKNNVGIYAPENRNVGKPIAELERRMRGE